ncbi:hypothetical protein D3C76_1040560 [compost metagenome]
MPRGGASRCASNPRWRGCISNRVIDPRCGRFSTRTGSSPVAKTSKPRSAYLAMWCWGRPPPSALELRIRKAGRAIDWTGKPHRSTCPFSMPRKNLQASVVSSRLWASNCCLPTTPRRASGAPTCRPIRYFKHPTMRSSCRPSASRPWVSTWCDCTTMIRGGSFPTSSVTAGKCMIPSA